MIGDLRAGNRQVVSQLPDFGEGSRENRRTRRVALGVGAFVVALIVVLVAYAIFG